MTNVGEQSPAQWQGPPLARKPKSTAAPRIRRGSIHSFWDQETGQRRRRCAKRGA